MRITGINVQNYLSFGSKPFDLSQLTEVQGPNRSTIVVGPNGAGKSNLLRVMKTLLEVLRGRTGVLPDVRDHYHRPKGDKQPIRLAMQVHFDDREWKAIALYWKLALSNSEAISGIANVPPSNQQQSRVNQVDPRQRQKYTEWLLRNIADESLSGFSSGELVYQAEEPDSVPSHRRSTSLRFTFANGLTLNMSDSTVSRAISQDSMNSQHLARRTVERLSEAERSSLALFLDNVSDTPLDLPSHIFSEIPSKLDLSSTAINGNELNSATIPAVLSAWTGLKKIAPSNNNGDYSMGGLVSSLIADAVVCIDHWTVNLTGSSIDLKVSPTEQLNNGDLASYLVGLKNGTAEEQRRYQTIQRQFQNLTGNRVDVQLKVIRPPAHAVVNPQRWILVTAPGQQSIEPDHGTSFEFELVTDHDLPLSGAGSGKAQILFWVTLMNAHATKVVLMDEPDHHLHPRMASKVAQQLLTSPAQAVVISHSPYMIPSGHLELVRRVSMNKGQSIVSPPITPDVVSDLVLRKRGLEPDDRLFLYANAVVFVEGSNDAEALRQWFGDWLKPGPDFLIKSGIDVRACVGKTQVAPLMRLADYFGIPNVGVWDFDVLLSTSKDGNDATNNAKVLAQWKDYGMVSDELVPMLRLDNEELFGRFPSDKVFLIGNKDAANLEQLFRAAWGATWDTELKKDGYLGPITYREWAWNNKWPEDWDAFMAPLLAAVRNFSPQPRVSARRRVPGGTIDVQY